MGCQRNIAEQIQKAKAGYVLALKGNQSTLHEDVKMLFGDAEYSKEMPLSVHTDVDGAHGRIETRSCKVIEASMVWIKYHQWPGLKTLVEITSTRRSKDKEQHEKRYYISSLGCDAQEMLRVVRSHWAIENSLHYVLDVTFKDDESRIRKGNAPLNMAIIRHAALNMLRRKQQNRESIKGLRKIAGWNEGRLSQIILMR
jgi:predicted transposase YbfD/YdcC